jgi:Zn-finger nucleic acid-binding protein
MECIAIDNKTIKVEQFSECEGICLDAGELDAV